jgi:homoserine kinase type II
LPLYTDLGLPEILLILEPYNARPVSFRHLSGGAENSNYQVSLADGNDCVVTVLENMDLGAGTVHAGFLSSLNERGLPVPRLWSQRDGVVVRVHQEKPVIVSDYIVGTCYDVLPARFLGKSGRALARVHAVRDAEGLPPPYVRIGGTEFDIIQDFADRNFADWLLTWREKTRYLVEDGQDDRVLTHGDFFADNVIVTPTGEIVILDWENGAYDSYLLDLGMAVLGLAGEGTVFEPARARDFLGGYLDSESMPVPWGRLLDAVAYAAVFTAYHRYLKHEINDRTSGKQGSYRAIPELLVSTVERWDLVAP